MASNAVELPSHLEGALISNLPASAYYISSFLTAAEEPNILTQIYLTPAPRWTYLSRRRLLSLPSPLTGKNRDTLIDSPLPTYLHDPILQRFHRLGLFADSPHHCPNHVLINEYQPGQGIMPHEDGPVYHPTTATVSLRSAVALDVYEKSPPGGDQVAKPTWRILQEPGSLLVTTDDLYRSTLHGIAETRTDQDLTPDSVANWDLLHEKTRQTVREAGGRYQRETRISLTYRDVVKVMKVGRGAMGLVKEK